MNVNPLLIGLFAWAGIKLIGKKNAAERLQYFVQKVSFRLDGLTPVIDIICAVQNPTGETLTLGSIVGDVYIDSVIVAGVTSYQLTRIKGMSITYLPISARLSISGVISEAGALIDAIKSGGTSAIINKNVRFKGTVNAEGISLPLDFTYKVL